MNPGIFAVSAKFINLLNLDGKILLIAILGLAAAASLQWILLKRLPIARGAMLFLYVIVFVVDVINGTFSFFPGNALNIIDRNVSGSRLGIMIQDLKLVKHEPAVRLADARSAMSIAAPEINSAVQKGRPIVLIIAESLGEPLGRAWEAVLFNELLADTWISDNYSLRRGIIPFWGSTTSAELRELCSIKGNYRSLTVEDVTQCLPHQLKQLGYESVAYHGFSGAMFDRREWWPLIGLERNYFAEDLVSSVTRRCGTVFRGLCDEDILETMSNEISARKFVYFLTLQGHFPADNSENLNAADCNPIDYGKDLCAYSVLYGKLFRKLKSVLKSVDVLPLVVVVGDHSPPQTSLDPDQNSFRGDVVPFFVMSPKR